MKGTVSCAPSFLFVQTVFWGSYIFPNSSFIERYFGFSVVLYLIDDRCVVILVLGSLLNYLLCLRLSFAFIGFLVAAFSEHHT